MSDCIFCKIANKEIPAKITYEDEKILCFHDLDPQAPVHVLIIPKKHISSLDAVGAEAVGSDAQNEEQLLLGHLLCKVNVIAKELGVENGYRLVSNCGEDGLQTVQHLHFHLLGKRKMIWPPG